MSTSAGSGSKDGSETEMAIDGAADEKENRKTSAREFSREYKTREHSAVRQPHHSVLLR